MHRRWLAAAVAALLLTTAPASARQAGVVIGFPGEPSSWRERAAMVMEHGTLGPALREHGYGIPANAEIYLAEVVPGVGQPAMMLYDAGQGAFSQNFWPASSVKLLASVAALESVGRYGFTGAAEVVGSSIGPRTIRSVYEPAIVRSDNHSYDLLVRMAGIDFVNLEFVPGHGLDSVTIGSDLSGLSVLAAPAYDLTEWIEVGEVPAFVPPVAGPVLNERTMPATRATRAYRSNNIDLFDLGEVVRRVLLDDELPAEQRFSLDSADVAALTAALCTAEPAHYRAGARRAWGDDVTVCGKSGWWEHRPEVDEGATGEGRGKPKPDPEPSQPPSCTDVALISDPDTGRRVLLAATGGCGGDGLAALVGPALASLDDLSGTPLQLDSGVAIEVALTPADGMLQADVATPAEWAVLRVDGGDPVVAIGRGGHLRAMLPMPADGSHLLVVTALGAVDGRTRVGYRAVDFSVQGA